MKVLAKFKKKKKEKKIESFKLDMRTSAAAALAHTPCSHQQNVVDHSFLLAVPRVARRHVKDRVSNGARVLLPVLWRSDRESQLHAWKRLQDLSTFFKLAARPSLKTPARRLLDVTVARRTCASKNIGKERGSPQVKSMLKALGKTDRWLVGVVLFARLECLRRNAPGPSRQRQAGTRPPNRDMWVRTVRNSRPPFVKRSGSFDQTSCLWSSRSLSLSSSFFFSFFISTFFRNGQGQNPPSPKRACPYFGKCGNLRTVP